jgi:hypothetical protein
LVIKNNTQMGKRIMIDFVSSIFTLQSSLRYALASRTGWRLPFAVLLNARNPAKSEMVSPFDALHMKASNSCKIQVISVSSWVFAGLPNRSKGYC